jgi:hypothetical protein
MERGGIMYWDRFDIVEAHYAFCCEWYDGQRDPLYARQCKIRQYFTPGRLWNGFDSLTENGKEIYLALCEKHGFKMKETENVDD